MPGRILVSTAYFPNLNYLAQLVNADEVRMEKQEHFIKQTYRNRCDVLTANGKLSLSIPLVKLTDKERIDSKRISYAENWQQQHWRTISSAYKNSPYFDFFEDEFRPFYETQFEYLFDFNLQIIQALLKVLRIKKEIAFTATYQSNPEGITDLRTLSSLKQQASNAAPYYQVFSDRYGFVSGLSSMDALFNTGLETRQLLQSYL